MTTIATILIFAALVTSGISAVLGMGGGITLLAIMSALLPAASIVPLHGVVQLASNFSRVSLLLRQVSWRIVGWYAPFFVVGVFVATQVWSAGKLSWLKPVIGFVILFFLYAKWKKPKLRGLPLWTFGPLGLVVGFLAIFVGATGPFLAPFFLRDELEHPQIVATKAACQAWGHILKIPAFLSLGFDYGEYSTLLVSLCIAVFVGTFLGKKILVRIPRRIFLIGFHAVLISISLWLILSFFL